MNKIIWFKLTDKEKYPCCYTLAVKKTVDAKWGDLKGFFEAADKASKGLDFRPLLFCMELLIRQGCARLNYFCRDIPPEPGAPLTQRGFYKPISSEELAKKMLTYQLSAVPELIVDAYNKAMETTISGTLTKEARENITNSETSNSIAWYDYHCRTFGISQKEYNLLTVGEIQDLSVCRAIQRGIMREEIDTPNLPRWK